MDHHRKVSGRMCWYPQLWAASLAASFPFLILPMGGVWKEVIMRQEITNASENVVLLQVEIKQKFPRFAKEGRRILGHNAYLRRIGRWPKHSEDAWAHNQLNGVKAVIQKLITGEDF